jgi:Glycosyl-4,4'-diaponeurosporenoate acyltransferase
VLDVQALVDGLTRRNRSSRRHGKATFPKRCLRLTAPSPARYYVTRRFEKGGRVYDLLGVRWYRRALRRVLWSVNPTLLRSQPAARETMIEHTKDAETGHLFILLAITGITDLEQTYTALKIQRL